VLQSTRQITNHNPAVGDTSSRHERKGGQGGRKGKTPAGSRFRGPAKERAYETKKTSTRYWGGEKNTDATIWRGIDRDVKGAHGFTERKDFEKRQKKKREVGGRRPKGATSCGVCEGAVKHKEGGGGGAGCTAASSTILFKMGNVPDDSRGLTNSHGGRKKYKPSALAADGRTESRGLMR